MKKNLLLTTLLCVSAINALETNKKAPKELTQEEKDGVDFLGSYLAGLGFSASAIWSGVGAYFEKELYDKGLSSCHGAPNVSHVYFAHYPVELSCEDRNYLIGARTAMATLSAVLAGCYFYKCVKTLKAAQEREKQKKNPLLKKKVQSKIKKSFWNSCNENKCVVHGPGFFGALQGAVALFCFSQSIDSRIDMAALFDASKKNIGVYDSFGNISTGDRQVRAVGLWGGALLGVGIVAAFDSLWNGHCYAFHEKKKENLI